MEWKSWYYCPLYWRVYHTDLPCSKTQWVLWKKKGCVLSRFIAPFWCLARTKLCLIYRSNTERHLLTKKDAYISWLNFFLSSHVAISLPTGLRLIFSYSGFLTYWKCFTICENIFLHTLPFLNKDENCCAWKKVYRRGELSASFTKPLCAAFSMKLADTRRSYSACNPPL